MKKPKEKKIKSPAARISDKPKKEKKGDAVEELFGVHVISDTDIEKHFGSADEKSGDETLEVKASTDNSKNKK